MATGGSDAVSVPLRELRDGIAYWRSQTRWPKDLHNAKYAEWAGQNPNGNFTVDWWDRYQLPRLSGWKATRGVTHAILTERFRSSMDDLGRAWREACLPYVDQDVTAVDWDLISAFPAEAGKIKPLKHGPSTVFTSKFCHFLLPRVFPLVDNAALGAGRTPYGSYFKCVKEEWAGTSPAAQDALIAELTRVIEAEGPAVFPGFPLVNKIVELRRIGRRHPGPAVSQHCMPTLN